MKDRGILLLGLLLIALAAATAWWFAGDLVSRRSPDCELAGWRLFEFADEAGSAASIQSNQNADRENICGYETELRPIDPASVVGDPKAKPVDTLAKSVGKLSLVYRDAEGFRLEASCTGFLVSHEYLLTNAHCIPGRLGPGTRLTEALLVMDFLDNNQRAGNDRAIITPTSYEVETEPVAENWSVALDYAVVRVHARNREQLKQAVASGRFWPVDLTGVADPTGAEELYVIQHPYGRPKRYVSFDCHRVPPSTGADMASERQFLHSCDTFFGSSGSPVFSQTNTKALLGLHEKGTGRRERPANAAVRMSLILDHSAILRGIAEVGAPQVKLPRSMLMPGFEADSARREAALETLRKAWASGGLDVPDDAGEMLPRGWPQPRVTSVTLDFYEAYFESGKRVSLETGTVDRTYRRLADSLWSVRDRLETSGSSEVFQENFRSRATFDRVEAIGGLIEVFGDTGITKTGHAIIDSQARQWKPFSELRRDYKELIGLSAVTNAPFPARVGESVVLRFGECAEIRGIQDCDERGDVQSIKITLDRIASAPKVGIVHVFCVARNEQTNDCPSKPLPERLTFREWVFSPSLGVFVSEVIRNPGFEKRVTLREFTVANEGIP